MQPCNEQFTKLQLGLYTKQALGSRNKTVFDGHADITNLDLLDNIFLISGKLDLQVILKIKRVVIIKIRSDGEPSPPPFPLHSC